MTDRPNAKASPLETTTPTSIASTSDFRRAMLHAARELYQNEGLRLEVAKRIS